MIFGHSFHIKHSSNWTTQTFYFGDLKYILEQKKKFYDNLLGQGIGGLSVYVVRVSIEIERIKMLL